MIDQMKGHNSSKLNLVEKLKKLFRHATHRHKNLYLCENQMRKMKS